ncbi:cyclic nucleotide-binding and patatin-like phospholipase domain-containing protein [Algoriphagus sp.]|uniref:cyclic nucleotide-binding and patatin-like phospholipase domain-containing protein n=1 Tax=Algoriphagus sp. TaxID=1872435 RepID=UPI0025F81421|nr:cyclic nucleotide-binding and patatin-like phospholipase domain-containing protein [Algoriphagus sp.]
MSILKLLKEAPYFKDLNDDVFNDLQNRWKLVEIKCGHALLQQGDSSEEAYILLEGRLRAILEIEGQESEVLGEIARGEVVGEMGAVFGTKRNATIIAVRNSTLLQLGKNDFLQLLKEQKNTSLDFIKTIVNRTKRSFVPNHRITTVAFIPLSQNVSVEGFFESLNQAVEKYSSVRHLSSQILQSESNGSIPLNEEHALKEVLIRYEDNYSLVIYQADDQWNKWTETCLARADKIIWLADSSQQSDPTIFENRVTQACLSLNHADHELVLLHPSKENYPKNTMQWLKKRKLSKHYNVARNNLGDIQRLARFLTGNAIGVALSGGGVRSSVQMGILQAMMEGGIPVDIIGGTSGGALIGGGFSQITDPKEFLPIVKEANDKFKKARKLTVPLVSLFSGNNFTKAIKTVSHGRNIEDLWIDFFCLSLSLVKGKLVVHRTGPLWEAIRASTAVNGIIPPFMKDGDCLVDGGLVNACPTDMLAKLGAGKSIAIIASSKSGISMGKPFSPHTSGWSILLQKLNPFNREKISPSLATNILQTMYIASDHLQYRIFADAPVDLFIHPPIDEFQSMDVDSGVGLVEFGYKYGLSQIEKWKEELGIMDESKTTNE